MDLGWRVVRPHRGYGVHWLSPAVGPKRVLCHRSWHEHHWKPPQSWPWNPTVPTWGSDHGDAHYIAFLRSPSLCDSGLVFSVPSFARGPVPYRAPNSFHSRTPPAVG